MTELDILEFAMEIEQDAAKTYLDAAGTVINHKAKVLLMNLAQEELDHQQMLAGIADKVEAHDPLPKKFSRSPVQEVDDSIKNLKIGPDSTVEEIVLHAMGREKALLEIYEAFALFLRAGEFRDLCEFLADEERKHLADLDKLLQQERAAAE